MADTPHNETNEASDRPDLSYEQAIEALEEIIEQIEQGKIGLEDSIAAYRRGTALIKHCRKILDRAEQEIETLEAEDSSGDTDGGSGATERA